MKDRQRLYNARSLAKSPVKKVEVVKLLRNPLQFDPSRTSAIRRKVGAELRRRYMKLRKALLTMIRDRDVLGLTKKYVSVVNVFDPNQPRDAEGKWVRFGPSLEHSKDFEHYKGRFLDELGRVPSPPETQPSKAQVEIKTKVATENVSKVLRDLFGRDDVKPEEYASMVGAPDDAHVKVTIAKDHVSIKIDHKEFTAERRVEKEADGVTTYIENESFFSKEGYGGRGLGTQVFSKQVEWCQKLGISKITTYAVGSGKDRTANGYYTWPRFGYDTEGLKYFPMDTKNSMLKYFPHVKSLADLMMTKQGRDWWRDNGQSVSLTFDLSPNSRSIKTLHAYLAERARSATPTTTGIAGVTNRRRIDYSAQVEGAENPDISEEEDAAIERAFMKLQGGHEPTETPKTVTPTQNSDWKYETNAGKVKRFRAWLRQQMDSTLAGDALIEQWIQESHGRGAKRAYDELRKGTDTGLQYPDLSGGVGYSQPVDMRREEALRRIKTHKATVDKVKLLAGRVFTDMEGINAQMSSKMSRLLAEGLVKGWTPTRIANQMSKVVGLSIKQALAITRSELIRAHAEGTLDGLADGGESRVIAQVEFVSADDERVCSKCRQLEGRVYKIEDARGVIPLHANCRCAWLPLSKRNQRKITRNAFCPTGDGGGIDPTCPPKDSQGSHGSAQKDKRSEAEVKKDSKGEHGESTDIKPNPSATDSGGASKDKGTAAPTPKSDHTNPSEGSKESTPNPSTGLPRTFGQSGVKVTPQGMMGTPFFHGIDKTIDHLYKGSGSKPKLHDLADMAGSLPGSKVTAKVVEDGKSQSVVPGADKKEIQILVEHGDLGKTMKRRIGRDANGDVFVHNEFIEVWKKGGGTGTEIFGRGVENAKKLGAKYIACHAGKLDASGRHTMNGYITWPGMGYDESLKSIEGYNKEGAAAIRAKFPHAQSIQDVMDADGGAKWWKDNGFDLYHMKFDLSDGSRSMRKFATYLEESRKKREAKK